MNQMTDEEREEKIADCGKQIEICMAAGDFRKANYWRQQQANARASQICETFDHLAERDMLRERAA